MFPQKVGVLGSGAVAKVLAAGFIKHGAQVKMGTSNPDKLTDWLVSTGENASVGSFAEAAAFGDVILLAVKGNAAKDVLLSAGLENLSGKTVIDPTNPIADAPPVNGVLKFFTDINYSLMEELQAFAPQANFVKAFSCIGNPYMVNPTGLENKPTMFICGNNADAKQTVVAILDAFGHDVADMGAAEGARAIEPLCMLWCIPGFLNNQWTHAFRLMKA